MSNIEKRGGSNDNGTEDAKIVELSDYLSLDPKEYFKKLLLLLVQNKSNVFLVS